VGFGFISLKHIDRLFLSFQSRGFSLAIVFLLEMGMQIHISPLPALHIEEKIFALCYHAHPTPPLHVYSEATLPNICAA